MRGSRFSTLDRMTRLDVLIGSISIGQAFFGLHLLLLVGRHSSSTCRSCSKHTKIEPSGRVTCVGVHSGRVCDYQSQGSPRRICAPSTTGETDNDTRLFSYPGPDAVHVKTSGRLRKARM